MNRKQKRAKLRAARERQRKRRDARTLGARSEPKQSATVEGESAMAIFEALVQMQHGTSDDGLATLTIELPAEKMAPVARAHMRIEAELLIEDAALWTGLDDEARTAPQRAFDAFELLVYRTCAAMGKRTMGSPADTVGTWSQQASPLH